MERRCFVFVSNFEPGTWISVDDNYAQPSVYLLELSVKVFSGITAVILNIRIPTCIKFANNSLKICCNKAKQTGYMHPDIVIVNC